MAARAEVLGDGVIRGQNTLNVAGRFQSLHCLLGSNTPKGESRYIGLSDDKHVIGIEPIR
jgi:hypothetical protein